MNKRQTKKLDKLINAVKPVDYDDFNLLIEYSQPNLLQTYKLQNTQMELDHYIHNVHKTTVQVRYFRKRLNEILAERKKHRYTHRERIAIHNGSYFGKPIYNLAL